MTHPTPWQLVEGYVEDALGNVVFAVAPAELSRAPDEETARFIIRAVNKYKEKKDCGYLSD